MNRSKLKPYNDPEVYGFALGWAVIGPVGAVVCLLSSHPWLALIFAAGAVLGAVCVRNEWRATRRRYPDAITRPWGWHKAPPTEVVAAAILVDDWMCYCSNCDGTTVLEALTHTGADGCGARFTGISAQSYNFPGSLLEKLRPDLTVI